MAGPALVVNVAANLAQLRTAMESATNVVLTTSASLAKASTAFDGSKIISQAGAAVAAVDKLGGVATLTNQEQTKLNATLNQAIEKYQVLGKEAPAALVDMAQATTKATESTSLFDSTLGKMTAAFSAGALIDRAVSGLISFAEGAVHAGAQLYDLNEVTGLSIQTLQTLGDAAELSGGSLETAVGAVEMLEARLGTGQSGAVNAVAKLGLNFKELRDEQPDEMLMDIAKAVANVQDPVERAAIASQLFGKSWKEILPALLAMAGEGGDAMSHMSDETVKSLKEFDDFWKILWQDVKVKSAEIVGFFGAVAEGSAKVATVLGGEGAAWLVLTKQTNDQTKALVAATPAFGSMSTALRGGPLNDLPQVTRALADFTAATDAARKKAEEYAKQVQSLADVFTGKKVDEQITLMADALAAANKEGGPTAFQLQQIGKAVNDLVVQGRPLPAALLDIAIAQQSWLKGVLSTKDGIDELMKSAEKVNLNDLFKPLITMPGQIETGSKALKNILATTQNDTSAILAQFKKDLHDDLHQPLSDVVSEISLVEVGFRFAAQSGSTAAQEISQAFGATLGILEQIISLQKLSGSNKTLAAAGMIGGGVAGLASSSTSKTGNILSGVEAGAAIGSIIPGLGTAIGAGVGAVVGVIKDVFQKDKSGRQAVVDWVTQTFGGFDALHAKLLTLGADGEKLWVTLTQGVGSGNAQQAQAAIAAVTAALDKQQKSVDDLNAGYADVEKTMSDLGVKVPPELDPLVKQLEAIGDTKDAQSGLDGLTGAVKAYQDQLGQADAFKTIEQEMKDVGLSAGEMNAKFKQAADEESARTIAKEFADLAPYVADVNVLAGKFGDQIEGMVKDSLDAGVKIPESMKPIIQSLIDQGKLTDDNGKALKDMSGLNFESDPLTAALDKLNDTLDLMLKNLMAAADPNHGAFAAFADAGQGAADTVSGAFDNLSQHLDVMPRGSGDTGPDLEPHMAAGGIVTRPTRALIGEAGPEAVIPLSQAGGALPYHGPKEVHVHTYIDGKEIESTVVSLVQMAAAQGRIVIPTSSVRTRVSSR